MKRRTRILTALIGVGTLGAGTYLAANSSSHLRSIFAAQALAQQLPVHQGTDANHGGVVVELCDGVTKMEVAGLKPGQAMTRAQALAVTHALMADWQRKHPQEHWQMAQGQSDQGSSEWTDETSSPEQTPLPENTAAPLPTMRMENIPVPTTPPTARPRRTRRPTPVATKVPAPQKAPVAAAAVTAKPSPVPTRPPTAKPSPAPTAAPTSAPTAAPTLAPTTAPTAPPTAKPTPAPTTAPTIAPTAQPSPVAAIVPPSQKENEEGAEGKKQETNQKAQQAGQVQQQGAGNQSLAGPTGHKEMKIQQGDTYASFNDRDFKVWQANTDHFVQEGKEVFHDVNKLGGTIGVSCDMCHPDAANTHPETYPKYQVQLQRVALLRDMIEWCIENPVKGKTMDPNDERLRALEAYILAQRKGVALDYGKH